MGSGSADADGGRSVSLHQKLLLLAGGLLLLVVIGITVVPVPAEPYDEPDRDLSTRGDEERTAHERITVAPHEDARVPARNQAIADLLAESTSTSVLFRTELPPRRSNYSTAGAASPRPSCGPLLFPGDDASGVRCRSRRDLSRTAAIVLATAAVGLGGATLILKERRSV